MQPTTQAAIPLTVTILVMLPLGLLPNAVLATWMPPFLRNDKLLHFTFFGLFSSSGIHLLDALLEAPFARMRRKKEKAVFLCAAVLSLGADVVSEFAQALLSSRSFDSIDIMFNILGSGIGIGAWCAWQWYIPGVVAAIRKRWRKVLAERRAKIRGVRRTLSATFDSADLELGLNPDRWDTSSSAPRDEWEL
ncbi:hypothetical protein BC830DRAFT_1165774 [Chytriomyces sp. MP71]|nr:hypothetical protein BC830DRAFT_1165774 [Chytriomyces sp. MP71]